MAKTDNLTDFLTDLADGIRAKKGITDLINPQDFRSEIDSISATPVVEPITITENGVYPVPKGGSFEFDKEYKFKEVITLDDFAEYTSKATAKMEMPNGGLYVVVKVGDQPKIQVGYYAGGEIEPGVSFEACAYIQAIDGENDYRYVINADVARDLFGMSSFNNGDGWYSGKIGETIAKTDEAGSFTIPTDATLASDLATTAIFFDVETKSLDGWGDITVNVAGGGAAIKPLTITKNGVYEAKAGGVLEYDKEVKFKDVITEADFEAYVANATPVNEYEGQTIYTVARASGGGISLMRTATSDPSITAWVLMTDTSDGFAYGINASAMGAPIPDNCWVDAQTMLPIDAPTITMTEDPTLSANLATTAVFFDIEKIDAYCPVTVAVAPTVEPITITENGVYPVPKGGDLVEGKTYTFKTDLSGVDPADFMKTPSGSGPLEGHQYSIAMLGNYALVYFTVDACDYMYTRGEYTGAFPNGAWAVMDLTTQGAVYLYPITILNPEDGETIDNSDKWIYSEYRNTASMREVDPVSVTIPSPFDASFGYSLEELAVFFEGVGGTPLDGWGDITANVTISAPTIELVKEGGDDKSVLVLTDPNGDLTTDYEVYADDVLVATVPKAASIDVSALGISSGAVITVKAKAISEASNSVEYTTS